MNRPNETGRLLVRQLAAWGAEDIRTSRGRRHPRVSFRWRGINRTFTYPGSPGDSYRGLKNSIRDLRHMLGLVGKGEP